MTRRTHAFPRTLPAVCALAVLLTLLAGCQKRDEAALQSNGQPSQTMPSAGFVAQGSAQRDPSVPDAKAVFAAQAAPVTAAPTPSPTTLHQQAAPNAVMTPAEKAKAMPLAGQAGDHSSLALDKKKGK